MSDDKSDEHGRALRAATTKGRIKLAIKQAEDSGHEPSLIRVHHDTRDEFIFSLCDPSEKHPRADLLRAFFGDTKFRSTSIVDDDSVSPGTVVVDSAAVRAVVVLQPGIHTPPPATAPSMTEHEQQIWLAAYAAGFAQLLIIGVNELAGGTAMYPTPEERAQDGGAMVADAAVEGLRRLPAEKLPPWLKRSES